MQISCDLAEYRNQRPFAFELRRWGYAPSHPASAALDRTPATTGTNWRLARYEDSRPPTMPPCSVGYPGRSRTTATPLFFPQCQFPATRPASATRSAGLAPSRGRSDPRSDRARDVYCDSRAAQVAVFDAASSNVSTPAPAALSPHRDAPTRLAELGAEPSPLGRGSREVDSEIDQRAGDCGI